MQYTLRTTSYMSERTLHSTKTWILRVLKVGELPEGQGLGYHGPPIVRHMQMVANGDTHLLVIGRSPVDFWRRRHDSWGLIIDLGQDLFWGCEEQLDFFTAVVQVAVEFNLREDPEVAAAIDHWFFNYVAARAQEVHGALAIAETSEGPKSLRKIAINTRTGESFAWMDEKWVAPDGQTFEPWNLSSEVHVITLGEEK